MHYYHIHLFRGQTTAHKVAGRAGSASKTVCRMHSARVAATAATAKRAECDRAISRAWTPSGTAPCQRPLRVTAKGTHCTGRMFKPSPKRSVRPPRGLKEGCKQKASSLDVSLKGKEKISRKRVLDERDTYAQSLSLDRDTFQGRCIFFFS